MNLSLKKRIAFSFAVANIMVLVIGFTIFYFLNSLNDQIEVITQNTNQNTILSEEISISAVRIIKLQKLIITNRAKEDDLEQLKSICSDFQDQLQNLSALYDSAEVRSTLTKMISYVDSLQTILGKVSPFDIRDDKGRAAVSKFADRILESFTEIQDIQFRQNQERDKQIKKIVGETRRYMLIDLIITFFATILLSLVIPGNVALPFKKINDAVRELQDCNFDVSIYYNKDDEIGELAKELNKMISSMKNFEDLRTDRISVERRKFDILANMVRRNVLIANANGELIYLNNQMYNQLNLDSDSILNKNISDTVISNDIKDAFELAIKRRSKIENHEICITHKKVEENEEGESIETEEDVFNGYANVIPIRAKESALDYYMMVLSKEAFS
ncbi:MAG: hypothetical protein CME65_15410 [Halobacteriovoraceae bacterium]|nr:hypothetical protein [Halobacteriovoraceae bacterium]|tara:strand:- start:36 stop:1202 length:1167 start_codon:yes stop_codon:yes gene_type:complete